MAALEAAHGKRRDWVWAELGERPLAGALAPLAKLAKAATTTLGGANVDAAVTAYVSEGWRCDRAALEALASVKQPDKPNPVLILGHQIQWQHPQDNKMT